MSNAQLIAIIEEAKQIGRDDKRRPLVECPIDGSRLQFRNGVGNCPLGNYRTTRTTSES